MTDDFLSEKIRAEDIILGSLGFDEDAKIVSIEKLDHGFKGTGKWSSGEEFNFVSDDSLSELEEWALTILK